MELCFSELKAFNDKGAFLGKHPFIAQRSERDRVEQLLHDNPSAFLDEMKNIDGNISRYRSHCKSPKYTGDKLKREQDNLQRYEALKKMYQEILENKLKQ